ncbi:hypothetical protein GCM10023196_065450 [Actinoallomurus vinaceus]|uniref:Uncharacterized protein n=1 Tax=Actinoallomurus vinaceus TaxID=1080074 RepID=A0ABP8UJW5_9ACTN
MSHPKRLLAAMSFGALVGITVTAAAQALATRTGTHGTAGVGAYAMGTVPTARSQPTPWPTLTRRRPFKPRPTASLLRPTRTRPPVIPRPTWSLPKKTYIRPPGPIRRPYRPAARRER